MDNSDAVLLRSSILQHTRFPSSASSDGTSSEGEEGDEPEEDQEGGGVIQAQQPPLPQGLGSVLDSALPSSPPRNSRLRKNGIDDLVGRKELLRVIGASNKLDWCLNFKRTLYDQKIVD